MNYSHANYLRNNFVDHGAPWDMPFFPCDPVKIAILTGFTKVLWMALSLSSLLDSTQELLRLDIGVCLRDLGGVQAFALPSPLFAKCEKHAQSRNSRIAQYPIVQGGTSAERSWHEIFFSSYEFLTKNAPKFTPIISEPYFLCPKKIPATFPAQKCPSPNFHRRASAGAQGEQ